MFRMDITTRHALLGILALALTIPAAKAQQTVLPLWPHGTPEPAQTTEPEKDVTKDSDNLINGHRSVRLTNVTVPTMTVYQPPADKNTRTAALVFPGGGYARLAWTGEGTDTCDWLTSVGITCLLVKYRVPQPQGEAGHYPADFADLEDAQQAMRLARAHAGDWHIDPSHIGVIGFSAGGNLAVLLSTHPDDHHIESTPAAHDIPGLAGEASGGIKLTGIADARPNFAIVVYPAYLAIPPDNKTLDPVYAPNQFTPPTFLIQAEDDKSYGFNAPIYYQALAAAKIPAELHMYASGGHGFGIHPPGKPEEHWTRIADIWLRTISMLPPYNPQRPAIVTAPATTIPGAAGTVPCVPSSAAPQQQQAGRPNNAQPSNTNGAPPADTPCYQ
jgi:acetyl esterase/lipase